MKAPLLWLAAVILVSCSPNAKLRRAKRLISEAEAAGVNWRADTVFKTVTVEIPAVRVDTVVRVQEWRDTIVITKDRIITKVKVNPVEKTVYVETKADSIVITKIVPQIINREIKVGYSTMGVVWRAAVASLILAAFVFVLCKLKIL